MSSVVPGLAVAITAMDSMRTIERCVASARAVSDRVVVVDSGSTDGTIERARELGAEVVHRDWTGFADQKRFAMERAAREREAADPTPTRAWVLILDSDEAVEPDLAETLRTRLGTAPDDVAGYELNRKLFFLGELLHHALQPEWKLRLVRPERTSITTERAVHERIEVDGRVDRLPGTMWHHSWTDVEDMSRRGITYAKLAAEAPDPRGGTILNLFVSPPAAFVKQLVVKRGILDGWRGWIIAGSMAAGTMQKHLFLMEKRRATRETR